jgi:hypothetical protein
MEKYTVFLSSLKFFTSFRSQVGKNQTRGENILLFLLKLITKKLSRKEGKGMARGKNRHRGETLTKRERIFSPSTPPVKVEQLLHGLGGKNKDTGVKNIIYSPPTEIRRYCHKKIVSSRKKFDLISLLPHFPPVHR